MIETKDNLATIIEQPVRQVFGRVGFTSTSPYTAADTSKIERVLPTGAAAEKINPLVDFTVERTGSNKFFGYGIMTKAKVHFEIRKDLVEFHEQNDKYMRVSLDSNPKYGVEKPQLNTPYFLPWLHVTDRRQDETTNIYSYIGYDNLEYANNVDISTLKMPESYTIKQLVEMVLPLIEVKKVSFINIPTTDLERIFVNNYEGKELVRNVLDEAAEVVQAIYYIDKDNNLVFKRIDKAAAPLYTINKANIYEFSTKGNRRLQTIQKVTELGDNVSSSTAQTGSTQSIRNNSLLEKREDIATLLDNAIKAMGDITIADGELEWRGNPFIELGDKVSIQFKDKEVPFYLLNDTMSFDGALSQKSEWTFEDEEGTDANPSNLGDVLNDTFAKVDKANKQIDIAIKDIQENSEDITSLQLTQNQINATVSKVEKNTQESIEGIQSDIVDIKNSVNAQMTPEQIQLEIQKELTSGVDKITTSTGFTFDEKGLTVSKSGRDMTTTITEDGMTISRDNTAVLVANNHGVDAYNLHARTYLVIGETSRFESYESSSGESRTGWFWIGG